MHNIIIIDDDYDYRQLLCTYLKKVFPDTTVTEYDPIANGVPKQDFDWSDYDCLILDYYLCIQNFTGLDLLKREQTNPDFPASIVLTGAGSEEIATKSLKFGANKYISKQGLTKGDLRESVEEAWHKHQDNLRKRRLIERRNRVFNKTRFYQILEATPKLDFEQTTRCLLSIEITPAEPGHDIDLITRNSILKHLAMLCFRYLFVTHPDLCITTLNDNSVALIMDFEQDDQIKQTIRPLLKELLASPYKNTSGKAAYSLVTVAAVINEAGVSSEEISSQFRLACKKARSISQSGKNILIHSITARQEAAAPVSPPRTETETGTYTQTQIPAAGEARPVEEPSAEPVPEPASPARPEPPPAPKPEPEAAEPVSEEDDSGITESETQTADLEDESGAAEEETGNDKYEIRFDESKLSAQDKKIIKALDEHRIVQVFQPVIVFNTGIFDVEEYFHVSLRMVDKLGDEESAQQMFAVGENPEVSKYIDRWMIKEAISHVIDTEPENRNEMFMIQLSHHSLSDTTLFNWLRELLAGIGDFKPGAYIALEISIADLLEHKKQVTALMQFLTKSWGFHFILGHIRNTDDIKQILDLPGVQMLMLSFEVMDELKKIRVEEKPGENFVNYLKQKDIFLIAREVNDSTQLMEAIAAGADFAMGEFVGEPQTQLDESSRIETYDLENRFGSTVF